MVDSYLSTKFGINLLHGFCENAFYERTTDNGCPCHNSSSAHAAVKLKEGEKPNKTLIRLTWELLDSSSPGHHGHTPNFLFQRAKRILVKLKYVVPLYHVIAEEILGLNPTWGTFNLPVLACAHGCSVSLHHHDHTAKSMKETYISNIFNISTCSSQP